MHILCLSRELDFLRQVNNAFSDRISKMDFRTDPEDFLVSAGQGHWNLFLVDLDLLTDTHLNPVALAERLGPDARILMIGSSSLDEWREKLEGTALLLHKPTTIGEIGLGLRKLSSLESRRRAV